ncbi:hypothetical protein EJ05DRAFT_311340 [Pseudovirgaria hyperparasitica]|uniref:Heterokaryon incompatibility domain-containing protein n=1 Tax=Pseudovirgaria hyperparasitica TaxID=470096 RepID=A0A6A6WD93_9PEZI|nr:uncharacterized protein EJ05DRAFT_311340 [Pseudovirgaria hyperparasitica]KAF2759826.1 hypothetical protein EJ05DRAFT_311340 [Pseudovirgaria hyperparasitica]
MYIQTCVPGHTFRIIPPNLSMTDYTAIPIDSSKQEIRLLCIKPYDPSCMLDFVTCKLITACLDLPNRPQYGAVSYTWDNPFRTPQMTVSEALECPRLPPATIILSGSAMIVTGNLEAFLRHLRANSDSQSEILIWVDALCINQSDDEEKSGQLPLMRRIYAGAENVRIWLGPGDQYTDEAIDFMNDTGALAVRLGVLSYKEADLMELMTSTGGSEQHVEIRAAIREMQDSLGYERYPIEAIKTLYSRWWWFRTWTVQELCLARKAVFICGTRNIPVERLIGAHLFGTAYLWSITASFDVEKLMKDPQLLMKLQKLLNTVPDARPGIMMGMYRRYQNRINSEVPPLRLIQVLVRTHARSSPKADLGATNPRDRVYGLLGLAEDAIELDLKVDYGSSIEDVYIDTALKLLMHRDTDILALAQKQGRKLSLPSWVPDWSGHIMDPCGECILDGFFRACGDTQASVVSYERRSDGCHVLGLEGLKICVIKETGSTWKPKMENWKFDWDEFQFLLKDVEEFCAKSKKVQPDKYEDAVVRTLCFDQERVGSVRRRAGTLDSSVMLNGYRLARNAVHNRLAIGEYVGIADFTNFQITLGDLFSRRPFLSDTEDVGLAPADAKDGDVICIFKGAIVPFTLRPKLDGTYELLGEAYVYGAMDGELMVGMPSFETFNLI